MRPWRMVLLLAGAALLARPGGADEKPASWHAQALAYSESGFNITYFWSKGPKLRAETVIAGHPVVTIVNGEFYYAYDELLRQGLAIRRAPEARALDRPDRRPFGREFEILTQQGAEKVSETVHNSVPCDVYRITDDHGKRELCVTRDDYRLPVLLELYSRKSGQTRFTDYMNWLGGIPLEDDFFKPDPGISLKSLGFDEYLEVTTREGPLGPVPVLYADLLYGARRGPDSE